MDLRYYQDRGAALRQLFTLSSLIVANRGDMAQEEFHQLLDQPENRPYRSHVRFCPLPMTIADLSATAVRNSLAAGKAVDETVPAETASFLAETHAFAPPLRSDAEAIDVYAARLALLELLYTVRSWAEQEVDFRRLLQIALTPSEKGRALRHSATGAAVKELVRS